MLRAIVACVLAAGAMALSGCTPAGLLVSAAGVATDTSVSWEVVKHLHGKLTEGDPTPCQRLDSVHRALNPRCGEFVPGSVLVADLRQAQLQECPLAVAARDPRLWPVLPEFIDKGAVPEACTRSPLVELAHENACPDFASASPAVLRSLRWLAQVDARAIHHDVLRMLSCPSARAVALDDVLTQWLAQGELEAGAIGFGVLGALHPDHLDSAFARALEANGHTARAALASFDGAQPPGFEEALRTSHWAALDWWLTRLPELANRVPPSRAGQLAWTPLARVLVPTFLAYPQTSESLARFLMDRGADPWQHLPFSPGLSVREYARALKSPLLPVLLDPPAPTMLMAASRAGAR